VCCSITIYIFVMIVQNLKNSFHFSSNMKLSVVLLAGLSVVFLARAEDEEAPQISTVKVSTITWKFFIYGTGYSKLWFWISNTVSWPPNRHKVAPFSNNNNTVHYRLQQWIAKGNHFCQSHCRILLPWQIVLYWFPLQSGMKNCRHVRGLNRQP